MLHIGLEGVDPEVDRGPGGEGGGLIGAVLLEHPLQGTIEPVWIVAGDGSRSLGQRPGLGQPFRFLHRQGARPVRLAGRRLGDLLDGPAPGEAQGRQGLGARPVGADHPGQRALAAQAVQHQPGDPGAIL